MQKNCFTNWTAWCLPPAVQFVFSLLSFYLLPLFLFFEFNFSILQNAYINSVNLALIGFLMVSKVPTFSLKSINFSKKIGPWILLLIVIFCIGIISNLWITLSFITLLYLASIIYTIFTNLFFQRWAFLIQSSLYTNS